VNGIYRESYGLLRMLPLFLEHSRHNSYKYYVGKRRHESGIERNKGCVAILVSLLEVSNVALYDENGIPRFEIGKPASREGLTDAGKSDHLCEER
jgi:hypothetical protein